MNKHPRIHRSAFTLSKVALLSILLGTASISTAVAADEAAQLTNDSSASERIALAGQLRMLSERVVSASCFLHAGIEADSSRTTLATTKSEFEAITAALEFGDPEFGIVGAEDRRRTLAGIAKMNELWAPISTLAMKVDAGASTTEDVAAIASQGEALLDIANRLIVQVTSQYANQTTVLKGDAVRLDISGRQQMLAQTIAKNGCLISRGINVDTGTDALQTAADNFDTSINALRFGLQEVGILPPPTTEIADSLDEVANNWSFMSRFVSDIAAGNATDEITLGVVFLMSNQVTDNMGKVVDLYTDASKVGS